MRMSLWKIVLNWLFGLSGWPWILVGDITSGFLTLLCYWISRDEIIGLKTAKMAN
ncbi:MAG: hypothetical protein V8S95_13955 [Odoribacter sp.]